jgi:hypothetical protein
VPRHRAHLGRKVPYYTASHTALRATLHIIRDDNIVRQRPGVITPARSARGAGGGYHFHQIPCESNGRWVGVLLLV